MYTLLRHLMINEPDKTAKLAGIQAIGISTIIWRRHTSGDTGLLALSSSQSP